MKKTFAIIIAILMFVSSTLSVAAFNDVSPTDTYSTAINKLYELGIAAGKTETTFDPEAPVTRLQMAIFIARASTGVTDDTTWTAGTEVFSDCYQYLGAVQYCLDREIINGTTPTTFSPNDNILLRDGLIMAIRALGYEKENNGETYNNDTLPYWEPYYTRAAELGLLNNLESLSADKKLSRAETAQLIYNMINTKPYSGLSETLLAESKCAHISQREYIAPEGNDFEHRIHCPVCNIDFSARGCYLDNFYCNEKADCVAVCTLCNKEYPFVFHRWGENETCKLCGLSNSPDDYCPAGEPDHYYAHSLNKDGVCVDCGLRT